MDGGWNSINTFGGGQAHNNMPPYLALNYIIKYDSSNDSSSGDMLQADYDQDGVVKNAGGITPWAEALMGTFLQNVYPVGCLYISKNATMPANIAALGTWQRLEGVFIAAASDNDIDFSVENAVRGSKRVTLSSAQIPTHGHSFTGTPLAGHAHSLVANALPAHSHIETVVASTTNGAAGSLSAIGTNGNIIWSATMAEGVTGRSTQSASAGTPTGYTDWQGAGTPSGTIGTAGSGQSHDNMPPYLARYVWERTA